MSEEAFVVVIDCLCVPYRDAS